MPGKIKVNFKMPPETATEKMYRKHQELRKKSGLPDPDHYKKLAAQKQKEIDAMKNEEMEQLEMKEGIVGRVISKVINKLHSSSTKKPLPQASDRRTFEKPKMEEVEQLDEMPESSMKTRDVHAHLKKSGWSLKRTGGGHDVYSHPKSKEHIAVPRHKQLKAPLIRGIMKASRVSEEIEIDEQLHKKGKFVSGPVKKPYKSPTVVSPIREAKDTREYDYEGDMAISQLRSMIFNAQDLIDMMDDNTNLPEWVQSKITLAEDYISTAANYLRGELSESVNLNEGRPSQRHPLEGHEYHKKTDAELEYIGKDAHKAAEAMKGHNTTAENKYRDQANDAATVRYFRKKSGTPDWYKKKYGHVKEETELDEGMQQTLRKYVPGYAKKQIDKKMDAEKFGRRDVDRDANFWRYKKIQDKLKKEETEYLEEKNVPTSPEKWAQAKAQAKQKFDVYPSAYANGWAAKKYKEMGGGWKSVNEDTDDPSAAARTLSRKAQIVKNIAKNKKKEKEEASDKFQKDPELSSDMQKT